MSLPQLLQRPEVAALLRENHASAEEGAQEFIVLELYRRGAISSGKAAELLGWERVDFIKHASRLGIPFFQMSAEEWEIESATAQKWAAELPADATTPETVAA